MEKKGQRMEDEGEREFLKNMVDKAGTLQCLANEASIAKAFKVLE